MAIFTQRGPYAATACSPEDRFFREHGCTKAPVVVQCLLTLRCPLSCPHCLAAHDGRAATDMPADLFEKLCRESAALGVQELLLTGGEPLQYARFDDAIGSLQRHRLIWSLNTATCPDAEQRRSIERHPPAYVAVSLDGPAELHNAFRGSPRAYADATEAIRWFATLPGTTVGAGTTITARNAGRLDDTFAVVKASGAHRWGIHLLLPEGRAAAEPSLFPGRRQMRRLLGDIVRMRAEFPVSLCDEMGYAGEWEPLVRDEAFFCAAGRAMCAVLPDGSVMPCSTLDPRHAEGNLARESLAEIWRTGFAAQRRPHRPAKCAGCADWAVCGSGCWIQRVHGTQCFRHLWKLPESVRAAAGVAVCVGSLQTARAAPAEGVGGGTTNWPQAPLAVHGIFASKAGPGRFLIPTYRAALAWLLRVRNPDGSWGSESRRAQLTPLAALAVRTAADHAASTNRYDEILRDAHRLIERAPAAPEADPQPAATADDARAWYLAESSQSVQTPGLEPAALAIFRPPAPNRPAVLRVLAWEAIACAASEADLVWIRKGLIDAAPAGDDPADRAARNLTLVLTQNGQALQQTVESIRAKDTGDWRTAPRPFLTMLTASRLFSAMNGMPGRDYDAHRFAYEWNMVLWDVARRAQRMDGEAGWWDAAALGVAGSAETAGMSDQDARIYVTALMTIALTPSPRPPAGLREVSHGDVLIRIP